jgi:hypothetical protein
MAYREKHPSGAKAHVDFAAFTARLKRLRKKGEFPLNLLKNIPHGLKPAIYYQRLAARLKSCPDTKLGQAGVFPQPVKP